MTFWEFRRVIRGYRRRGREAWERTRWQTFWLLHNGWTDLQKAGIYSAADLIRFPWDKEADATPPPTDEEINAMRKSLQVLNAKKAAGA